MIIHNYTPPNNSRWQVLCIPRALLSTRVLARGVGRYCVDEVDELLGRVVDLLTAEAAEREALEILEFAELAAHKACVRVTVNKYIYF